MIELAKLFLIAHTGLQHPDAEFPKSFYDKISEELSDRFPEENTFIVDLAWAKSVLGI